MAKRNNTKKTAVPSDPLNLPALKRRYDELKAQQLGVFQSMDALPGAEIVALEDLLIAKKVLPTKPKAGEIYDGLQKQNQALAAELKELRAKLAEHEGKEKRLDLVRRVMELSDHDATLAKAALECIENDGSFGRPAEEFISNLLTDIAFGHSFTPEKAEEEVKDFRHSYEGMRDDTKRFLAAHPDIAAETAGA